MSDEVTLSGLLLGDNGKRNALIADCERLIDSEVSNKRGLSGVAIKGGYKVVSKVKPGIIREVLDKLLDQFVDRLEPQFKTHLDAGGEPKAFGDYLLKQRSQTADALLGVTDDRAKVAQNRTLKSAYEKLRPQAKKHVEEAIPGAARVFAKHIGQ